MKSQSSLRVAFSDMQRLRIFSFHASFLWKQLRVLFPQIGEKHKKIYKTLKSHVFSCEAVKKLLLKSKTESEGTNRKTSKEKKKVKKKEDVGELR